MSFKKVQTSNDERTTGMCSSMAEQEKELEAREETTADFLSSLRHVLRAIQELKYTCEKESAETGNRQDVEVLRN